MAFFKKQFTHSLIEHKKDTLSQLEFTCSKLTKEALEQGVNMFKVNNKDTRTIPGVVLVSLLLTLNIFRTLF